MSQPVRDALPMRRSVSCDSRAQRVGLFTILQFKVCVCVCRMEIIGVPSIYVVEGEEHDREASGCDLFYADDPN